MPMNLNTDLDPEDGSEEDDGEWGDEVIALSTSDLNQPLGPPSESHRAAFRRAIEIAKEERALRTALDDFSNKG
ncbi:MAG: hypothetical protein ACI8W7_004117 [Gammaproteobacteria bacterium]|jgi:hypothetical protein